MTWQKNYDKCMRDNDGYLIIVGGHFNLRESRKIIKEENYDEPTEWKSPKFIYVRFGFVNFEGETTNGFLEFDDYKKGRIKATRLKEA